MRARALRRGLKHQSHPRSSNAAGGTNKKRGKNKKGYRGKDRETPKQPGGGEGKRGRGNGSFQGVEDVRIGDRVRARDKRGGGETIEPGERSTGRPRKKESLQVGRKRSKSKARCRAKLGRSKHQTND